MPFAKVGDAELHYEVHGSGPTLVLSAGMGGVGSYWKPQIAAFAERHRVIVYDQRGTGRSTLSETTYTVELLAADLVGLMDALGIDRADAVGHSTGGMFMQAAAVDHPERFGRLVMYGTRASTDDFSKMAMGTRLALLRAAGPLVFHRATPLFLYPSHWIKDHGPELEQAAQAATGNSAPTSVMASRIEAVLNHDQTARVGRITSPTLVLCANDDYLTPPYYSRALAAIVPGSRLDFVSWGGHACSQTNPAEFNEKVLSFLAAPGSASKPN
jgi:aminoacrylate hydrolase